MLRPRGPPQPPQKAVKLKRRGRPRELLEGLRAHDPGFSTILFGDFLTALYVEAHTLRGAGQIDKLAAYIDEETAAPLRTPGVTAVRDVIVGALAIADVHEVEDEGVTDADSIERVARKKWSTLRDLDDDTRRRRLYGFLARRGFNSDDVSRIVRQLAGEDPESDET